MSLSVFLPIRSLGAFGQSCLDTLLPPRCLACGELTLIQGTLCGPCWEKLVFITAPFCTSCGSPMPYGPEYGEESWRCAQCLAHPPAYDAARAACVYNDASRPLIHGYKYYDRLQMTERLAEWMRLAGEDILSAADMLCPVPLHWRRLFQRGYNQSALLAMQLARRSRIPCQPRLLQRRRYTAPQAGLTRQQRLQNLKRAFALHPRYAAAVRGKHVVLVDDVMTTGTTAEACCRVLRQGGAARVSVLTFARTLR